jgi:hypothetical protein
VQTVPVDPRDSIYRMLEDTSRYVIVHFENHATHLKEIRIDRGADVIYGTVESIAYEHDNYIAQAGDTTCKYFKSDAQPLGEVHLYVDDLHNKQETQATIAYNRITDVKQNLFDKARTKKATNRRLITSSVVVLGLALYVVYLVQNMTISMDQ